MPHTQLQYAIHEREIVLEARECARCSARRIRTIKGKMKEKCEIPIMHMQHELYSRVDGKDCGEKKTQLTYNVASCIVAVE